MVSRRYFLAALGTGVSTVGLAGCQGRDEDPSDTPPDETPTDATTRRPTATRSRTATPEERPDRTATREPTGTATPEAVLGDALLERFGTVHDVTERGLDPTGSETVDGPLQRLVADDTLLHFPPGTYNIEDLAVEDVSNFGMVGTDATLRLMRRGRAIYLRFTRVSDVLIDGFTIDNTATNTAAWCDMKCTGGTNVIRNYRVAGFVDVPSSPNGFTLMVQGGDTSLELENVDLSQGSTGSTAAFVFPRRDFFDTSQQAGSLTFRNCVMKNWGGEGLYASAHEGPLRVIGGEYANNGIVQVRIGGGNAPDRAVVRDVTIRADDIPSYMPETNQILRGIWLKEGDGALIENCDITLSDLKRNQTPAAILVKDQFGRATIRDCTIRTENVARPAISVQRPAQEHQPRWMPSLDRLPEQWGVTVENVTIEGTSPNTEAIRIEGRDGCTVRDVTIDKEGENVDGLFLRNVGECTLDGGSMTTHRYPVVIEFAGRDDCVLEMSDASLTGTTVESSGSRISNDGSGSFCIGSDVLADSASGNSNRLALTRSEVTSDGETPTRMQLFGRWLPR